MVSLKCHVCAIEKEPKPTTLGIFAFYSPFFGLSIARIPMVVVEEKVFFLKRQDMCYTYAAIERLDGFLQAR
jgi:hypothetical protein